MIRIEVSFPWSVPENVMATVTLFHTGKVAKCEDKNYWMFVVKNVDKRGRHKRFARQKIL